MLANPGMVQGASSPSPAYEFESVTMTNADTIVIPSGATVGALAILIDWASNGTGIPAAVTPAGFTEKATIGYDTGFDQRLSILTKKIVSGDRGATVTGMNGDAKNFKTLYILHINNKAVTTAAASVVSDLTSGNPPALTVTAGSGAAPLLIIAAKSCIGNASGPVFTSPTFDREDLNQLSNDGLRTGYIFQTVTPANVTVDSNDDGNAQITLAFYQALT